MCICVLVVPAGLVNECMHYAATVAVAGSIVSAKTVRIYYFSLYIYISLLLSLSISFSLSLLSLSVCISLSLPPLPPPFISPLFNVHIISNQQKDKWMWFKKKSWNNVRNGDVLNNFFFYIISIIPLKTRIKGWIWKHLTS